MDYMLPAGLRDAAGDSCAEQVGQASAERGQPWLWLSPRTRRPRCCAGTASGQFRDVGQRNMVPPPLWERTDPLRPADLSRIAHARIPAGRLPAR